MRVFLKDILSIRSLEWSTKQLHIGKRTLRAVAGVLKHCCLFYFFFLCLGGAPCSDCACFKGEAGEKSEKTRKKIICGILDIKNSSIMYGAIAVVLTGSITIRKISRFPNLLHLASQIKWLKNRSCWDKGNTKVAGGEDTKYNPGFCYIHNTVWSSLRVYHHTDLKPKQQKHKNHYLLAIHTLLWANEGKETSRIFIWLFLLLLCSCHNFCE